MLAEAARQRLQYRPAAVESPAVLQANLDFFEAVVSRNAVEAKRAFAVMAPYARSVPRLTPAAQAKQDKRTAALVKLVGALRERRDEEARGVVYPQPTPEQRAEAKSVLDRFKAVACWRRQRGSVRIAAREGLIRQEQPDVEDSGSLRGSSR